jgi:AcrR family transcriptional regulator
MALLPGTDEWNLLISLSAATRGVVPSPSGTSSGVLALFNQQGIEATTIDVIRAQSEMSGGAIYHHFDNKEGLVAALYMTALDDQARLRDSYLSTVTSTKDWVHALVFSYADWVVIANQIGRASSIRLALLSRKVVSAIGLRRLMGLTNVLALVDVAFSCVRIDGH